MTDEKKFKLVCPSCKNEISVDEALRHQIAESEKLKVESEYQEKLEIEKKKMWPIALEKASEKSRDESEKDKKELEFVRQELENQKKKRAEAEAIELKLRKEKIQLEEDRKAFELSSQRQLDAERTKIKEEISKKADEEHRLKDAEKDKMMSDMRRTIEELRRKSEQGSQQTQGEVLELELEKTLAAEFPMDEIRPVPKGINGADVIQTIHNKRGRRCGSIAWEMKRTKAWTEGWVQKLKDDQRRVKAELAILISEVLPGNISEAGYYNGIYLATPKMALSLGSILRRQINEIADVMSLEEGKSDKKDMIWGYLMGPEFRGRINSFLEAAVAMKKSLDQEKRAYSKIWAEREKLIGRIEMSMAGLSGEIKGIAGRDLLQIEHTELSFGEEMSEEDVIEPEPEKSTEKIVTEKGDAQQLEF